MRTYVPICPFLGQIAGRIETKTEIKKIMAEQKLLQLTIARVDGPLFDGQVLSVTLPGIAGEMTLLAEHTPLISPLKEGVIIYQTQDGQKHTLDIASGTLEVSRNRATVLI